MNCFKESRLKKGKCCYKLFVVVYGCLFTWICVSVCLVSLPYCYQLVMMHQRKLNREDFSDLAETNTARGKSFLPFQSNRFTNNLAFFYGSNFVHIMYDKNCNISMENTEFHLSSLLKVVPVRFLTPQNKCTLA